MFLSVRFCFVVFAVVKIVFQLFPQQKVSAVLFESQLLVRSFIEARVGIHAIRITPQHWSPLLPEVRFPHVGITSLRGND